MLYDRSLKKFKKLFPDFTFDGYENSFGSKCWVSVEGIRRFTVIRTCLENRIKLLRAE